jgi:nicotinamide-nucleotide amidase
MDRTLEERAGAALNEKGWTLALGESCTGGLIAHRITDVPGSSNYFLGGVMAYSNSVKERLLGVKSETLEAVGAVSEEIAREMAQGASQNIGSDVGISVTCIAGPGGGTDVKPVGLTYIGASTPDGEWVERHLFQGDRKAIKESAANAALELLLNALGGNA